MYDRYTIISDAKKLESMFGSKFAEDFNSIYNASPTQLLPVITSAEPATIQFLRWGFISTLSNNKSISPRLFNVPSEGVFDRPMYRNALKSHRCIILADGFYAWKQVSKKQRVPQYFYFASQDPFGIAGIWEESEDLDGNQLPSFNMLVGPANSLIVGVQEDMPIILDAAASKRWLDPNVSIEELQMIAENIHSTGLKTHPVSPRISNTNLNDQSLIQPATPSDQHGNYTLFN